MLRRLLPIVALILFASTAFAASSLQISWLGEKTGLPIGEQTVRLQLTDSQGQPVSGAAVKLTAAMGGMSDMAPTRVEAAAGDQPGIYTATVNFSMTGAWKLEAVATAGGQEVRSSFDLTVGAVKPANYQAILVYGTILVLAIAAGVRVFLLARRPTVTGL